MKGCADPRQVRYGIAFTPHGWASWGGSPTGSAGRRPAAPEWSGRFFPGRGKEMAV